MAYDGARGILYTLSRNSTIQMFDLGADGESFRYVDSLDAKSLAQRLRTDGSAGRDTEALRKLDGDIAAAEKAKGGGADAELHCAVVALSPIAASLTNLMQLVLTSASGVRIYLQSVPNATNAPTARPVHLRPLFALPP